MSFSYDPGQLETNPVYAVRFELSDVDEDGHFLEDEEIAWALSVEPGHWGASARCAESISRRLLAKADTRLGRYLQVQYTTAAQQYMEMAKALRQKALGTALPYVGGRSLSEKLDRAQDTDAEQPIFVKRLGEDPRVGGYSNDDSEQQSQDATFHP